MRNIGFSVLPKPDSLYIALGLTPPLCGRAVLYFYPIFGRHVEDSQK
jgi:hypothetical protein